MTAYGVYSRDNQQPSDKSMKSIPSAPHYLISPQGEIYKNGKQLKINRSGSVRVAINRRMRLVSELLAETHLDMPIGKGYSVIYLGGDNQNIELSNLMWVDQNYSQITQPTLEFEGETFFMLLALSSSNTM